MTRHALFAILLSALTVEAQQVVPQMTVLDTDHEFDAGSRVAIDALSAVQIDNLATLGKVWGFLKYHHPAITSGSQHWDYDLFRVLPGMLAARGRAGANAVLVRWITDLGGLPAASRARRAMARGCPAR